MIAPQDSVPKQQTDVCVVGLSGRICAGKTTAARLLEQRGFAYTRFSLVIDEEISRRGQALNRESRQRIGTELHEVQGQRWLSKQVMLRVSGQRAVVVDGLRFPDDHACLLEWFGAGFFHFHIHASPVVRGKRYREYEEDGVSFELADAAPVEEAIGTLARLAHFSVFNEGTVAELTAKLWGRFEYSSKERGGPCLSQL